MAFLDCNIFEVNKFPRYGSNLDHHTLATIFHYTSDSAEYQNNNVNIQIPEHELVATKEDLEFVYKYKEIIIGKNIPVIRHVINNNMESWAVDVSKVQFLKYLKV